MIKSFRNKGLAELFELGHNRRIQRNLHARCLRRLEVLEQAKSLVDVNIPGFNFHGLHGTPKRYSIHINGPWCITFIDQGLIQDDATDVAGVLNILSRPHSGFKDQR